MITAVAWGGTREGAGRKSAFPGKGGRPYAMDFTKAGRKALDALARASGLSRNDVIAHLAIAYADALTFESRAIAYPFKAQKVLSIRVTDDAGAALERAHTRTGHSYSDIGEALVRQFGPKERAWPVVPEPDRKPTRGRKRRKVRRGGAP